MKTHILSIIVLFIATSNHFAQNHSFNTAPHYAIVNTRNINLPINQVTIECWIKPNTLKNWVAPFSFIADNGHNESGFAFAYYNNQFRFMIKTDAMRGDEWNYNPGSHVELNQWSHIAGTYDGGFIKFYLNGELIDTKQTSGQINWDFKPKDIHIGAFKDFNENLLFDGQIDEVRIWNTARSATDINKYKNKKINQQEDALIGYYNFDQLDKGSIIVPDLSKYKLDGRLNIPANEETLVQSGAMIIPVVTELKLLTPSSFLVNWECSESVHNFDHYMIELSKDRAFNKIFMSEKSTVNQFKFENIPGGSMVYMRIKAFSKEIGYTSYSDIKEINDFRTGLSVVVTSIINKEDNIQHRLISDNQLNSNYLSLPTDVRDVKLDFRLNNETPENIRSGHIVITGPYKVYETSFSKNSDISLFNLAPGIYNIEIDWGSIDQEKALSTRLRMEVKPNFFRTVYFKFVLLLVLFALIFLFVRKFTVIDKQRLLNLKKQLAPKENTSEWIDPEILEDKAIQIKECIDNEKLYLDPKFNLKSLGTKVDIPHYQVSKILNDYYRTNFNDFINEFRVKEFVNLLKENDHDNIKNSALAYQCGFYSESTFFRAFKKFMGKSPQQFRKELNDKHK
ncbi:LamG-like jellyroll fold domain-containing protein [Saccharicrinis sp. GN24d3]|uniref:LamG-like jellyroll fold domain-containing protein n=1 Tax=Saccharicrinis sp. GN24d3 TaxID=3458416 RepID=UPI0040367DED